MSRPLTTPLPADLPENWTDTQYVSPGGIEVGLSEKHGYNYQSRQINAAQRAVNALNEAFEQVLSTEDLQVLYGRHNKALANTEILLGGENTAPSTDQPLDYPQGVHLYLQTPYGGLKNTPSEYGLLLSMRHNDEITQLWFTQAAGTTYRRGGNHVGWASGWTPMSDSVVAATIE